VEKNNAYKFPKRFSWILTDNEYYDLRPDLVQRIQIMKVEVIMQRHSVRNIAILET